MSYIAINIPVQLHRQKTSGVINVPSNNSTRSFKTASRKNTTNTNKSFATAKSYNNTNNNANVRVVNTNDPNWLTKEGVNTSYNINVESRKRWLARQAVQPIIRNRITRRNRSRRNSF